MSEVLCIRNDRIPTNVTPKKLIELAASIPSWIERKDAESDEAYRQVIPYMVIRTRHLGHGRSEHRFLSYQRSSKISEGRLASKISMGLGGHIERCDEGYNPLVRCAERELEEEIACKQQVSIDWKNPLSVIISDKEEVDRVHIGLVLIAYIENSTGINIESRDAGITNLQLRTIGEHRKLAESPDHDYEVWSKRLLGTSVLDPEPIPGIVWHTIGSLGTKDPLDVRKIAEKNLAGVDYWLYKSIISTNPVATVELIELIPSTGICTMIGKNQAAEIFGDEAVRNLSVRR